MPENDFPDFQLIPDTGPDLTPADEAALFTDPDDVAPTFSDNPEVFPYGRTIWMDWSTGQLNQNQWVSGPDAAVQVAQVALNTVRGTSILLPPSFGRDEPKGMLGEVDSTFVRVLHSSDIRDTLLSCHERITAVNDFRWTYDPDQTCIGFEADVEMDGDVITLVGGGTGS